MIRIMVADDRAGVRGGIGKLPVVVEDILAAGAIPTDWASDRDSRALGAGMTTETMFRSAGLLAVIMAGMQGMIGYYIAGPQCAVLLPGFAQVWAGNAPAAYDAVLIASGAGLAVFAAVFWETTKPAIKRSTPNIVLLIAVQVLIGFFVEPHMLIMVAAEFPFIVSRRTSLRCLIGLGALVGTTGAVAGYWVVAPARAAVGINFVSIIAWQIFAFVVGYVATSERRNRMELAAAHSELLATQQLLAENSRTAERLHIARELHDALGHHLAALSLHLDLAGRQAAQVGSESLGTARDIARQLLAEVRTTVGAARNERPINLRQALQTLCSGIPSHRIDLSFDERFEVGNPSLAHVIFRSVQEAISNAIRHSGADAVKVVLATREGGLEVSVADNGKGACDMQLGNGLRGMRERVEEHGGMLEAVSGIAGGFSIRIWLPQRGSCQ